MKNVFHSKNLLVSKLVKPQFFGGLFFFFFYFFDLFLSLFLFLVSILLLFNPIFLFFPSFFFFLRTDNNEETAAFLSMAHNFSVSGT